MSKNQKKKKTYPHESRSKVYLLEGKVLDKNRCMLMHNPHTHTFVYKLRGKK